MNYRSVDELRKLPQMKWSNHVDNYIFSLGSSAEITGGEGQSAIKELSEKIRWLASRIHKKFSIRYGNDRVQDKHSTNASQTLMVYNPFSHVWIPYNKVGDVFTSALNRSTNADSNTEALAVALMNIIGMQTPLNTIPPAYTGTRYQLFLNGIYDLKEDTFTPMEDVKELEVGGTMRSVEDMGFTDKHIHNIMWNEEPRPPVFEGELEDGGDWDFREWLLKINGNDADKRDYLLFLIGLMALPNTNIGINIVLAGPSGSGKSTIGTLIAKLYTGASDGPGYQFDNSVGELVNTEMSAEVLNDTQFPFRGTLTKKVNFVHLSEANGTRLTTEGSVLFDKFGDQEMEARLLHKSSVRLNPTPTLFMEGTKWANFDSVKHGVERRIMPFRLNPTDDLPEYEAVGLNKSALFDSERILEWLIAAGFQEIRKRLNRYDNITINMMRFDVPEYIQEWRQEISGGGDDVAIFYKQILQENLRPSKQDKGADSDIESRYINYGIMYDLYRNFKEMQEVPPRYWKNLNTFSEAITEHLKRDGYSTVDMAGQYRMDDYNKIALDLDSIKELMYLSEDLSPIGYSSGKFGNYKKPDWMILFHNEEDRDRPPKPSVAQVAVDDVEEKRTDRIELDPTPIDNVEKSTANRAKEIEPTPKKSNGKDTKTTKNKSDRKAYGKSLMSMLSESTGKGD